MEESDLKTGMIVELIDDHKEVIGIVLGKTVVGDYGGVTFDRLSFKDSDSMGWLVNKVYSRPNKDVDYSASLDFWIKRGHILKHCNLLWERETEKIVVELDGVEYSVSTLRSLIKKATS